MSVILKKHFSFIFCDNKNVSDCEEEKSDEKINDEQRIAYAKAVSRTLDHIFDESRYDPRFRPGAIEADYPTVVEVNIYVRSSHA